MPPGTKHKSHINQLKNRDELHLQFSPKQAFLSRQQSRADAQIIEPPSLIMSRQKLNQSIVNYNTMKYEDTIHYRTTPLKIRININMQKQIEIPQFECKLNETNQILINRVIADLKNSKFEGVEQLSNASIAILNLKGTQELKNHDNFTNNLPVYENIGIDPLQNDYCHTLEENQDTLDLMIRNTKQSLLNQVLESQPIENGPSKTKQTKQRNLSEVVERVALWRRLYSGFYDQNKTLVQMQLDKAAERVGIQKKTLDDYLLQIRYGKRYGFNFNQHCNEGISKLRQFVKNRKDKKHEN